MRTDCDSCSTYLLSASVLLAELPCFALYVVYSVVDARLEVFACTFNVRCGALELSFECVAGFAEVIAALLVSLIEVGGQAIRLIIQLGG